ncbi:hypothetical protein SAY86_008693 [Trapa natans]|uniref:Uncharacterized protein n=1 Tax=Trapa natans TaxID=22666 RepID=A0AAN7KHK9_TRANT|nr:hypothetical protein SAY86_008693 [Trapa natans]
MVAGWRRRAWRWRGEETVRDHMSGEGDSRKVQGEMEEGGGDLEQHCTRDLPWTDWRGGSRCGTRVDGLG